MAAHVAGYRLVVSWSTFGYIAISVSSEFNLKQLKESRIPFRRDTWMSSILRCRFQSYGRRQELAENVSVSPKPAIRTKASLTMHQI
jgi:hypothetical protein